ncbi:hypothetical protein [Streptomyces natalensis]|uniref:hypothetical protein n=1 Tax=Streptomyces natalensis TaxID=68242 RepID=UPI000699E39F|nr:hypothetical protein [Streptomyces natalensis]
MKRYRALFRHQGLPLWSVVRALTRFPIVGAPIGFVLLARTTLGTYPTGAWMAAAYMMCETIAAPVLGARFGRGNALRGVRCSLLTAAAAFLGIALVAGAAGTPVLLALAGTAGAATAGLQGGLRSLLTTRLDPADVPTALSWESVIHQFVYALGPVVVAGTAFGVDGRAPMVLAGTAALAAALLSGRLPGIRERTAPGTAGSRQAARRALLGAWPVYLTSAGVSFLIATVEVLLAPLLDENGLPASLSGPLLGAFAVTSLLGGLCYGLRTWRMSYRSQSLVLLIAVATLVGGAAVAAGAGLVPLTAFLLPAGALYAALLTARNLSLRERLPRGLDATGYSLLYAGSGLGFGLSAALSGVLLTHVTPHTALLVAAGATLLLAAAGALAEPGRRTRRPSPPPPARGRSLDAGAAHEDRPAAYHS